MFHIKILHILYLFINDYILNMYKFFIIKRVFIVYIINYHQIIYYLLYIIISSKMKKFRKYQLL
jgi:hypothetical protein